jgi:dihydroorotase
MDPVISTPADLAVTGKLVLPAGVVQGTVVVRAGRIESVVLSGEPVATVRSIDVGDRYVLPGLIDSHVHFRSPGLTHKEDWTHGGRAAVAGGVTTVIDMPNTTPPLWDPALAAAKAEVIGDDTVVDYRFHLGIDPENPSLLLGATPREAVSAKLFMAGHHCAPHVVRTPEQLSAAFATAASAGLRLLIHAEDQGVYELLDRWQSPPSRDDTYASYRPRTGPLVAAASVIRQVEQHGTAAHIVHVSTREECDLYAAAAAVGLPITFEVTAHHLSFTEMDLRHHGTRLRLSPAIREQADQDRLWAAVRSGQVATIGSDHAPHLLAEKLGRPAEAPPGLPGVQELAAAVFTGLRRQAPLESADVHASVIARLLAANPAAMFGMAGQKGCIAPGHDADLLVFDPDQRWSMTANDVQSKCGWSAYEGWSFVGRVLATIRRGEVVFDLDKGVRASTGGRWLDAVVSLGTPVAPAVTSVT